LNDLKHEETCNPAQLASGVADALGTWRLPRELLLPHALQTGTLYQ